MKKKVYKAKRAKRGAGRVREAADFFPVTEFFAGSGLVTEALKDSFNVVWANDVSFMS